VASINGGANSLTVQVAVERDDSVGLKRLFRDGSKI